MRDTLIEFMDELREYVAESGANIAHDERDSSEFVDIFLNKGQTLPIDSVSGSFSAKDMENFAAKCMILGNNGKDTKELLKDFCKYDR